MCYRCEVCNWTSKPGEKLLKWVLYREREGRVKFDPYGVPHRTKRKEIRRELRVCRVCHATLHEGVPLGDLMRRKGTYRRFRPAAFLSGVSLLAHQQGKGKGTSVHGSTLLPPTGRAGVSPLDSPLPKA